MRSRWFWRAGMGFLLAMGLGSLALFGATFVLPPDAPLFAQESRVELAQWSGFIPLPGFLFLALAVPPWRRPASAGLIPPADWRPSRLAYLLFALGMLAVTCGLSWLALARARRQVTLADLPAYAVLVGVPVLLALILAGLLARLRPGRLLSRLPLDRGRWLVILALLCLLAFLVAGPAVAAGIFPRALPPDIEAVYLVRSQAVTLALIYCFLMLVAISSPAPQGAGAAAQ